MKTALVAGSTGLSGEVLVNLLLADTNYHQVFVIVRQVSIRKHGKLVEHQVEFDKLALYLRQMSLKVWITDYGVVANCMCLQVWITDYGRLQIA